MSRFLPIRHKQLPHFSQRDLALTDSLQRKPDNEQAIKCQDKLKIFINHDAYNFAMALLTVYSIFAIDIEKSYFGQQSAYIFGYVHIVAITIFTIEMTLSSIGREGYKCSFYFWIDAISTLSMVMEITWVDNYLADNTNIPGVLTIAKVVKASRLSRIGSRAAKIIFIFLQYLRKKKVEEEKIRMENKNTSSVVGQSNFKTETIIEGKTREEPDYTIQQQQDNATKQIVNQLPKKVDLKPNELQPISQEKMSQKSDFQQKVYNPIQKSSQSRSKDSMIQPNLYLGKRRSKLSHIDNSAAKKKPERGKAFQITNIVQRMEQTFKLPPLDRPNVDPQKQQEIQQQWRQICQRDADASKQSKQKLNSDKENFKLGQTLKQRIQKNIIIMIMSLIIILPLISADTWFNQDPTIDQLMDNYFKLANLANQFLQDMVDTAQEGYYPLLQLNFSLFNQSWNYPGNLMPSLSSQPPLSDFMQVELINEYTNNFVLVFNGRQISRITALMNIARSCFITVLLIFSTIIFMHSIEHKALIPLQNMCISINKISVNPFDAVRQAQEHKEQVVSELALKNDLETNMLERTIWKMTKILALGAGETGAQLISTKIDSITDESSEMESEGAKIHGVFLAVKICHFERICDYYSDQLLLYINKISANLHEIVMNNGGVIIDNNPPSFLFFWKTPEDLNIQQEPTKYYVANNPLKNLGKTIETQRIIQMVLRTYLQISISLIQFNKRRMHQELPQDDFQRFTIQAGVHIGDGYRGSVGNKLKIEVKCIGPDIEYAKGLCNLSQEYRLSNLLSYDVYEIMDDPVQANLRKVDFVRERGWQDRVWLCTYDFTLIPLVEPHKCKGNRKWNKVLQKLQRTMRNNKQWRFVDKKRSQVMLRLKSDSIDTVMPCTYIQKICLQLFPPSLYDNWNQGIQRYYSSQWDEAAQIFQNFQFKSQLGYKDPISIMFLKRIRKQGGVAPKEWQKAVEISVE